MHALTRCLALALFTVGLAAVVQGGTIEYRVLATKKTSTMETELNQAAEAGYRFRHVMGGDTSWGGSEVVAVMSKEGSAPAGRYLYKLLATNKTSTMQKELQEAGDAGYEAVGQTVFKSTFGGEEVVIILERDAEKELQNYEYKLLATNKTGTMEKELLEAGASGYDILDLTVAKTAMGGSELVCILRRTRTQ